MFHSVAQLTPEEVSANVQVFIGNGTPFLKVPGLEEVETVRVGTTMIPLETELTYPTDPSLTTLQTANVPMVALQRAEDGTPVLLRSMMSNDGIWQKGERVYVGGKWSKKEKAANTEQPESAPQDPPKE